MDADEKVDDFVQERLDSLFEVECQIVSLIDRFSSLFQLYSNDKKLGEDELKKSFEEQTEEIYETISHVAIGLRKEVRVMDSNVGVYDNNDEKLMILPVSVDQKNTQQGKKKLKQELLELEKMISQHDSDKHEDADTSVMEGVEDSAQ